MHSLAFLFFKQKTAYEMRISDWSSDVCSSDLYTLIALSTCGRSEAILDLHDHQIDRGLIYFLDPDRDQTSKRRSIVPIAPTLAPWLEGASGKIITYRAEIAPAKWAAPDEPEYFQRDCYDLGKAFDACLVEAGLTRPVIGADGNPG